VSLGPHRYGTLELGPCLCAGHGSGNRVVTNLVLEL
jgi:hypothetical protein